MGSIKIPIILDAILYTCLHIQNVIVLFCDWRLRSWLACVMTRAFKYIIGWLLHVMTRSLQGLENCIRLTSSIFSNALFFPFPFLTKNPLLLPMFCWAGFGLCSFTSGCLFFFLLLSGIAYTAGEGVLVQSTQCVEFTCT